MSSKDEPKTRINKKAAKKKAASKKVVSKNAPVAATPAAVAKPSPKPSPKPNSKVTKKVAKKVASKKKVAKKAPAAKARRTISYSEYRERVAMAAYFLAQNRLFQDGLPDQDWLEGEAQVSAALAAEGIDIAPE